MFCFNTADICGIIVTSTRHVGIHFTLGATYKYNPQTYTQKVEGEMLEIRGGSSNRKVLEPLPY